MKNLLRLVIIILASVGICLAQPTNVASIANNAEQLGEIAVKYYNQQNGLEMKSDGGGEPPSTNTIRERSFTGAAAGDYFGLSVSDAGDVNGDGYNDIIIGAPYNDAGGADAGRAYIFFGGLVMDQIPDVILTGVAAGDYFGFSVSTAGDVNGDGYSDVIVGAYRSDVIVKDNDAGRAYIFFGGSPMNNIADVSLFAVNANDWFGISVSSAGDVNGDGYSDVIVGSYGNDSNGADAGRAYVYYGGASMNNTADVIMNGAAAGDYFGYSVSGAGDLNGDGFSDVIAGGYLNDNGGVDAGRAYIYFGAAVMDSIADVRLNGAAAGDRFGFSVSDAGDVNGDGYSDVIIGAPRNDATATNAGRAYIYFGGRNVSTTASVIVSGAAAEDWFGYSVSGAGDVNGDGYSDVIVGALMNDAAASNAGRVYVYFGGNGMDNITDVITSGVAANDYFGGSVSNAGDVNGDGYSDLLVGAYLNDATGINAGSVYLYLNSLTGNDIADEFFKGRTEYDSFGYSVSSAGDVNGDGYNDIIIGAYNDRAVDTSSGCAYIYYGGPILNTVADVVLKGAAKRDYFGFSVSAAGDVNGDGYSDVIVGLGTKSWDRTRNGKAYVFYGGANMDSLADVILTGEQEYDGFGSSIAGAGDVNGDGYSDVVVGAPYFDQGDSTNAGRAYIYYGGSVMDNVVDVRLYNWNKYDLFGYSVSSAGDVNGDGFSDFIVGAPFWSTVGPSEGKAYIYFGSRNMNDWADVIIKGTKTEENLGRSVSCAGDVNSDGYSDVIIGSLFRDETTTGRVYILLGGRIMDGNPDVTIETRKIYPAIGEIVSSAGDVNGDGFSDIILGSGFFSGGLRYGAYVFWGGVTMDNIADIELTGDGFTGFGTSVSSAGDINGDGYADVLVGSPFRTSFGGSENRVFVYLSSSPPIVPRIASVKDVPNDQGGYVTINWIRSGYDARGINKVKKYVVERSLPSNNIGFAWEAIATITAAHNPQYSYTSATLYDSASNTSGTMFFRVTAYSENLDEYWRSNIIYGHSVDNLPPIAPRNIAGALAGSNVILHWNPNTETDLASYAVYRSTSPSFDPDTMTAYATTRDTLYTDMNVPPSMNLYYKLKAVDIHGNQSQSSNVVAIITVGVEDDETTLPTEFALDQNYPNPFNPSTVISYQLPVSSRVTLKVFDLLGREVAALVNQRQDAGRYEVQFDGSKLTSGMYFYRLTAGDASTSSEQVYVSTKKFILMK